MVEPNSNYTRFFIKDVNGYLLYQLPQTRIDWFTWECDMCDRESEHLTILFQDGDTYWSLDWFTIPLNIEALVGYFVEKNIDTKELLEKHKILIKRSVGSEPDKGPWYFARPKPANL